MAPVTKTERSRQNELIPTTLSTRGLLARPKFIQVLVFAVLLSVSCCSTVANRLRRVESFPDMVFLRESFQIDRL